MHENEFCSRYITGDCDKEILAICSRFQVEVELTDDPYLMFDVSHPCEVNDGGGTWYEVPAGERVTVDSFNASVIKIRSDENVEYIKFLSDTCRKITIIKGENLITANQMCFGLAELEEVKINGFTQIIDWTSAFDGCTHLTVINDFFVLPETLAVYDEEGNEIEAVVPTEINMNRIFADCRRLPSIPDIDFTRVINLEYAFVGCAEVTIMQDFYPEEEWLGTGAFKKCFKLLYTPQSSYDKVSLANEMFKSCSALEYSNNISLDIATTASDFFNECIVLKIVNNARTPLATNIDRFFNNCYELKCVDYFDSRSTAADVVDMFTGAVRLQVPSPTEQDAIVLGSEFIIHSNCPPTYEDQVLYVEVTTNTGSTSIETPTFMCDKDVVVDWGPDIYCDDSRHSLQDSNEEENGCIIDPGFKGMSIQESKHTYAYKANEEIKYIGGKQLQGDVIRIYSIEDVTHLQAIENTIITKVAFIKNDKITSLENSFKNNIMLGQVTFSPISYDKMKVINIANAFYNCSILKLVPSFNCDLVTQGEYAFYNCKNIFSVVNDYPALVSAEYMFYGCSALVRGEVLINGAVARTLDSMFEGCVLMTRAYVKTDGCTSVNRMFYGCTILECINEMNTTTIAAGSTEVFDYCPHLISPNFTEQDLLVAPSGYDFVNNIGCPVNTGNKIFDMRLSMTPDIMPPSDGIVIPPDISPPDDGRPPEDIIKDRLVLPSITSTQNFFVEWGNGVIYAYRKDTVAESPLENSYGYPYINVFTYEDVESVIVGENDSVRSVVVYKHSTLTTLDDMFAFNSTLANCVFIGAMTNESSIANIVSMNRTFKNCILLGESPLLWTENVTSAIEMFLGCVSLKGSTNFTGTKLKYITNMFNGCTSLSIVDLNQQVVDPAQDTILEMNRAFFNCGILKEIHNIGISKCVNFEQAFKGTKIKQFKETIPALANYSEMFMNCNSLRCINNLNTIDSLGNANIFDNDVNLVMPTPNIITQLESVDGYDFVNSYNDCMPVFGEENLRIDLKFNIPDMFPTGALMFESIPADKAILNFIADDDCLIYDTYTQTYEIIKANTMFSGPAPLFSSIVSFGEVSSISFEGSNMAIAEIHKIPDGLTTFSGLFKDCPRLLSVSTTSETLTENIESVDYMLSGCLNLISTDISFPKCSVFDYQYNKCGQLLSVATQFINSATSIAYMFNGCKSIEKILFDKSPGTPDTEAIVSMSNTFNSCSLLSEIIGLNDSASLVLDFENTFRETKIKHFDMNTVSGTEFYGMFYNASELMCCKQINTEGMSAGATDSMFFGANKLVSPNKTDQALIEAGLNWTNTESCPPAALSFDVIHSGGDVKFGFADNIAPLGFKAYDTTGAELPLSIIDNSIQLTTSVAADVVVKYETAEAVSVMYAFNGLRNYKDISFTSMRHMHSFSQSGLPSGGIGSDTLESVSFPSGNVMSDWSYAFKGSHALVSVTGIIFENAISLLSIFDGCNSLSHGTMFNVGDTRNCSNFINMFSECSSLIEIDEINTIMASPDKTRDMFMGCTSLVNPDANEQTTIQNGSHWVNDGTTN